MEKLSTNETNNKLGLCDSCAGLIFAIKKELSKEYSSKNYLDEKIRKAITTLNCLKL